MIDDWGRKCKIGRDGRVFVGFANAVWEGCVWSTWTGNGVLLAMGGVRGTGQAVGCEETVGGEDSLQKLTFVADCRRGAWERFCQQCQNRE